MKKCKFRLDVFQALKERPSVGQTNIAPHYGTGSRNAREVSEASAHKTEFFISFRGFGHRVHERIGQHVRQVTYRRKNPVMRFRRHPE